MESGELSRFRGILFDLDGTLLDSLEDLANATNEALQGAGYPTHPVASYTQFVGNGLEVLVRRALPRGEAERIGQSGIERLMQLTGEAYVADVASKSRPYPGIVEVLGELRERRIPQGIVTNKPHPWTERLVQQYFPDAEFVCIYGAQAGIARKPDPTSALLSASAMGIAPESMLFLGDSDVDMRTAQNAGMCGVGAGWGFRGEGELWTSGARYVLTRPEEVLRFFD